eukprot:gene20235-22212_t
MANWKSVEELQNFAAKNLSDNAYSYYANGTGKGVTLSENVAAFKRYKVLPRYIQGVDCFATDVTTTILGEKLALPICASPSGLHKCAHKGGELETGKGCQAVGTCMAVSAYATCSYEDIADACPDLLRWCQMYIFKDRDVTTRFVRRAERSGYKALLVTVDTTPLRKKGDFRDKLELPDGVGVVNFDGIVQGASLQENLDNSLALIEPCLNWSDIEWLKSITKLPVVLKGIMSPQNAKEAVKYGVDGILVSNKGGRQFDVLPGTLDILPAITKAVAGSKIEIYLDGGVRNGIDVFKALALGARAVFLGRPVIWGLAYDGWQGVRNVFELMKDELKFIMANTGCREVTDINESLLFRHANYCCDSKL